MRINFTKARRMEQILKEDGFHKIGECETWKEAINHSSVCATVEYQDRSSDAAPQMEIYFLPNSKLYGKERNGVSIYQRVSRRGE